MKLKENARKASLDQLIQCCKNLEDWPSSWEIGGSDLKIGKAILEEFKPFLIDRVEKGRAKSTIKIYAQYLWALGGELIRQVNDEPNQRRLPAKKIILKSIDDSGGPLWRHARDGMDHARYDSVCKQLFRFLTKNST
jgi:hypothetical protein